MIHCVIVTYHNFWSRTLSLHGAANSSLTHLAMSSYTFRQGNLPKLDLQVDRGSDFKAWKSQWDAYIRLSGLDRVEPAKQVQALTLCFARETVTIVENLGLASDQRKMCH